MTVTFEGYERRADKIDKVPRRQRHRLPRGSSADHRTDKGFNPREIVNNTQSIAFQNAEVGLHPRLRSRCQAWRQDRF